MITSLCLLPEENLLVLGTKCGRLLVVELLGAAEGKLVEKVLLAAPLFGLLVADNPMFAVVYLERVGTSSVVASLENGEVYAIRLGGNQSVHMVESYPEVGAALLGACAGDHTHFGVVRKNTSLLKLYRLEGEGEGGATLISSLLLGGGPSEGGVVVQYFHLWRGGRGTRGGLHLVIVAEETDHHYLFSETLPLPLQPPNKEVQKLCMHQKTLLPGVVHCCSFLRNLCCLLLDNKEVLIVDLNRIISYNNISNTNNNNTNTNSNSRHHVVVNTLQSISMDVLPTISSLYNDWTGSSVHLSLDTVPSNHSQDTAPSYHHSQDTAPLERGVSLVVVRKMRSAIIKINFRILAED